MKLRSLEISIPHLDPLQAKPLSFYIKKAEQLLWIPGRKVKLTFGLMLDRKRAPLQLQPLGNTLTPPHQQRLHANGQFVLDWMQLSKLHALLTVPSHPALLIRVASSELLYASKEFNGSRSGIFMLLPLLGSQELIAWLAPLR